jgi:hypothetical protein
MGVKMILIDIGLVTSMRCGLTLNFIQLNTCSAKYPVREVRHESASASFLNLPGKKKNIHEGNCHNKKSWSCQLLSDENSA